MVNIVIIEQHVLLRLGLASLMAHLVSGDRITTQSHEDLYRGTPHVAPNSLVFLGAQPEERIKILIQAVRRIHAPKRILLLSDQASCPESWGVLPPLVAGYVSTRSSAEGILLAAQSLIHNHTASSPRGSVGVVASFLEAPGKDLKPSPFSSAPTPHPEKNIPFNVDEAGLLGLSVRQYEVLVLLAEGLPIKLICRHLNISMATTKGHIEALYQRLGAHNRNQAVFVAMANGAKLKMRNPSESAT